MSLMGNRLKAVRKHIGYAQKRMSEECGSALRSWQDYESGTKVPGGQVFAGLAELGVNANWVLTGHGPMMNEEFQEGGDSESADEFRYVSALKVEASAGHGAVVESDEGEDSAPKMAFRNDWLKREGLKNNKLAVIKAKGDSMEPAIFSGDSLLIDVFIGRTINELKLGKPANMAGLKDGIYILRLDGRLSVKRLQLDFTGGMYINSDNPAYSQIKVSKADMEELTIVGKVEWIGRRL